MTDDIRHLLDRTIEQKKVAEHLDRARKEHQKREAEAAAAAGSAARVAALAHWEQCVTAIDQAVAAINERSTQTRVLCDQAGWTEGGAFIKRINFHTGSGNAPPLIFALEESTAIRVTSAMGVRTFDIAEFGPKNVAATANSHFAAILQAS